MTDEPAPTPRHGGNIDDAVRRFGVPRHQWLDLSTGINPRPYPLSADFFGPAHWARLPGPDALAALKDAAAAFYGTPAGAAVAVAPGSQSLIAALPRTLPPARVAVLEPTYNEHARCWQNAGHGVIPVAAIDDAPADAPYLVVCNPNNPDGRVIARERLLAEAAHRAERGGAVIVDEAFADVLPEASVAGHTDRPGLIVLRSFGKFFGLAGVRLGFALCPPADAHTLERALGPWAVAGPVLTIGQAALHDANWVAETRIYLAEQAAKTDAILTKAGLTLIGGTDLFRLVQIPGNRAEHLAEALGQAGILVRTFPSHSGWMRFGLPGTGAALNRLAETLESL